MRRNILSYKAPPNNEGYDLICIHPDPKKQSKSIRVQVKSRLATDCNRGFPVKEKSIIAFDYLVVVFLNVGYFMQKAKKHKSIEGAMEPEFYTFPSSFIKKHHDSRYSWEKVNVKGLDIEKYKNEEGFELIAKKLKITYPEKRMDKT